MSRKLMCVMFIVVGCIARISCNYTTRQQTVEENCFPEFEARAGDYSTNSQEKVLYIWGITGESNGDRFLLAQNYVGFLSEYDCSCRSGTVEESASLKFTGRVVKMHPSWLEHYIGDSNNKILPEVRCNQKSYLMFPRMLGDRWSDSLPERCRP